MLCEKKIYVCDEYTCEGPYDLKTETFNGFCKINYSNGNYYEGNLKNNLFHNKGKLEIVNQYKYIGDWKDGKKHGFGIMEYANGDIYEGNFEDDMCSGNGVLKSPNKVYIYSEINKDKIIFEISDKIYSGNWKNNKKDGLGELKLKLNCITSKNVFFCIYYSEWKNDIIDSCEVKHFTDCEYKKLYYTYTGKVNKNLLAHDNNGKLITSFYITEGEFVNGSPKSFTKIFLDKKNDIERIECVRTENIHKGKIYYRNKNIYEGEFDDNCKKNGQGEYFTQNLELKNILLIKDNNDIFFTQNPELKNILLIKDNNNKYIISGIFVNDNIKSGKCKYKIDNEDYSFDIEDYAIKNGILIGINHIFRGSDKIQIFIYTVWEKWHIISAKYIEDNKIYEGCVKKHYYLYMRHGSGKTIYQNSKFDFYEIFGEYYNDRIDKGVIMYNNGDIYCGEIKNDYIDKDKITKHGKGKMKYKNGDVYDGDWELDKPSGIITIKNNYGNDYYNYYMCGFGLFSPLYKVENLISSLGNKLYDYMQIDDKKEK